MNHSIGLKICIMAIVLSGTIFAGSALAKPRAGVDSKAGQPKDLPKEGWIVEKDVQTMLEGYKEARWGMSPDQVKSAMADRVFKKREGGFGFKSMYYKDDIAGEEAKLEFMFKKNELNLVAIKFDTAEWLEDMVVGKFDKFLSILTDKYGKPLVLKRKVPDAHLDNPGKAIANGLLEFESNWQTTGTKITLKLESTKSRLDRKSGFDFRVLYRAVSLPHAPKPSVGSDL